MKLKDKIWNKETNSYMEIEEVLIKLKNNDD